MPTIPEALADALQHHRAGRLREAEQIYRQIVAADPDHYDAWHLLGVIACQSGNYQAGIGYIELALTHQPDWAEACYNLANAWKDLGKLDEAATCYRRVLQLKPDFAQAHNSLGNVTKELGKLDEATTCYQRALQLKPDYAEAHNNLGNAYRAAGKLDEATACYQRVLQLRPNQAEAHSNLGNVFTDQGRLDEAAQCHRHALRLRPDFAEVHSSLGKVLRDQGKLDEAAQCHQRALQLKPDYAEADNDLGNVLRDQGKLDEAAECYRRALRLKPDLVEAHSNLGNVLRDQGKLDEAAESYQRALRLKPDLAEAHSNLGNVLRDQGKLDEAAECYRRALRLKPDLAEGHSNLGNAYRDVGKLDEAAACYQRALQLKPDYAEAHNNLGNVLRDQGKLDEAAQCHRRALRLKPDLAEAHSNLGNVLRNQGKLGEAAQCHRRALQLKPDYAEAHSNLGNVLRDEGRLDEALTSHRRALQLNPDLVEAHSNLLMIHQYRAGATLSELAAAHAEYGRLHAEPLRTSWAPHANDRDPLRRLRLGFVSGDFGRHPVGFFLIQALENLDQGQCEAVCYCNRVIKDDLASRFQGAATEWWDIAYLSDQALAEKIRADRIDILFDLAGHTANNRLLVFARRPAPVQITWIGYEGTTGLRAIDYLLADRYTIPPGQEPWYQERILRLPDSYVCYDPPVTAPAVAPLPALRHGFVRFGSFNNPAKVTPQVVAAWAKILSRVPGSRVLLKYRGLDDERVCRRYLDLFTACGIDPSRVEFAPPSTHADYLATYGEVDIALDPFPFGGGITTCNGLWMGVPVITCPGETFASRHALSYLSNVGLTETIAMTAEEYVELAVSLASDLPRLSQLRAGLRERMAASPLCDGKRFAANLMRIVRDAWREWCQKERVR